MLAFAMTCHAFCKHQDISQKIKRLGFKFTTAFLHSLIPKRLWLSNHPLFPSLPWKAKVPNARVYAWKCWTELWLVWYINFMQESFSRPVRDCKMNRVYDFWVFGGNTAVVRISRNPMLYSEGMWNVPPKILLMNWLFEKWIRMSAIVTCSGQCWFVLFPIHNYCIMPIIERSLDSCMLVMSYASSKIIK